jgi:hypothetical protein
MAQRPDHHYQVVERQGRGLGSQYSRQRKRRRGCADNTILPATRMRGRPAQRHRHHSSSIARKRIEGDAEFAACCCPAGAGGGRSGVEAGAQP